MTDETLGDTDSLAVEEQGQDTLAEDSTEELEAQDAGTEGDESADDEGAEEKPKKKGGFQRRIERLEREKFEAQYETEKARQQIAEMQQYFQRMQQPSTTQPGDMPKLSDFDYDEARYGEAVQQWHSGQMDAYQRQQAEMQQQYAAQQAQMQREMALQQKVTNASEQYKDFVEKVTNPDLPNLNQVSPAAFEALLDSDQFGQVAYYLANNPSEIYAFHGLNNAQAIRRIAKLEAELAGGKKTVTKAPPAPPSKLGGTAPAHKRVEDMSMGEYVEWRRSQQK